MFNKKIFMFILFVAVLCLLTACGSNKVKYQTLADLEKATFAVPTGTAADQLVLSKLPNAKTIYFNTVLDCCLAVNSGKADAAAYDEPVLKNIVATKPELMLLKDMITVDNYGFAVQQDRQDLKKAIDDTVSELKTNGTYDEMLKRWLPEQGQVGTMPDIDLNGKNGTLRFGTSAVVEPFTFVTANNTVTGFDIELARRICQKLDMNLEIVNMDFGAMIPALISGKVDMIGACITITDERAKSVLFSEPYYQGGIATVVKK